MKNKTKKESKGRETNLTDRQYRTTDEIGNVGNRMIIIQQNLRENLLKLQGRYRRTIRPRQRNLTPKTENRTEVKKKKKKTIGLHYMTHLSLRHLFGNHYTTPLSPSLDIRILI